MVVIGILATLGGYTLAYYGYDVITGGNDSIWSLFWPGAYKAQARDSGSPVAPAMQPTKTVAKIGTNVPSTLTHTPGLGA